MGLFDLLFNKKDKNQEEETEKTTPEVNMTSHEEKRQKANLTLNLRKDTLELNLKKHKLEDNISKVAVVMDSSGSMNELYKNGTVQETLERILPLALKFDDDKELDIWLFSNRFSRCKPIGEKDFYDYVNREIKGIGGGTYYAPVIEDITKKYGIEEPSKIPTFVIFITDGENFDKPQAKKAIIDASYHNIFFKFIGIGDEQFKFLKELDDMTGRLVDNANFIEINKLADLSDEQLYDSLLEEYPQWIEDARANMLID